MSTWTELKEQLDTGWFVKAKDVSAQDIGMGVCGILYLSEEGREKFGIKNDEYAVAKAMVSPNGENGVLQINKLDEAKLIEVMNDYNKPDTYEEYVFAKNRLDVDEEFYKILPHDLDDAITTFSRYNMTNENISPVLSLYNDSLKNDGITITCEEILAQMAKDPAILKPYADMYANHSTSGYMMEVPVQNGDITAHVTAYVVTYNSCNKAVPYTYTNSQMKDCNNYATIKLLEEVAKSGNEASEWASATLASYKELSELVNNCDGKPFNYTLPNGGKIGIAPCGKESPDSEDYTFFLTDHPLIDSAWSLLEVAEKVNNLDALEIEHQNDIEHLQKFYEKNIYPFRNVPYGEMTAKQKDDFSLFSDRHKDIYGFRPNAEYKDMCLIAHNENAAKAKETIER